MVTRAAKDLLRNTIRTVDHHNRLLEEQEMWRQWELEQGLTMMVSDDTIRMREAKRKAASSKEDLERIKKRQKIEKYRRQCDNTKDCERKHNYWMKKLMEVEEQDPDRWGHGGYKTLYPDEFSDTPSKKRKTSKHRRNGNYTKKKKKRQQSRSRDKKPTKSKRPVSLHSRSSSTSSSSEECNSLRSSLCDLCQKKAGHVSDEISESDCRADSCGYHEKEKSGNERSRRTRSHRHRHRYRRHREQKQRKQHLKDNCRKKKLKHDRRNHMVQASYQEPSSSDSSGDIVVTYESYPSKSTRDRWEQS